MKDRPLRQAAAFGIWLMAATALVDFGLFRLPVHGWGLAATQVAGYVLLIAPIAVCLLARSAPSPCRYGRRPPERRWSLPL